MKKILKSIMIFATLFWGIGMALFMPIPIVLSVIPHYLWHVFDDLPSFLAYGLLFGISISIVILLTYKNIKYLYKFVNARQYYLYLHKYEMAIEYYNEVIEELKSYKPKSKSDKKYKRHYYWSTYNDIANCYKKLGNEEKSKIFFNKSMRFIPKNERQKYLDKISDNDTNQKKELSAKKKMLIKIAIVFIVCLGIALTHIIDHSAVCKNCSAVIVSTDNNETLNNVQNTLLNSFYKVIIEKDGTVNSISISNPKKYDVEHAIILVADSKYFDETISFPLISDTKNSLRKNYAKKLEKRLQDVLVCIGGVTNADVKITIPPQSIHTDEPVLATVTVKDFQEFSDVDNAKKLITNVLLGGVPTLQKENITLDIEVIKSSNEQMAHVYYWKADYNFFEKEYKEALDNLALAIKYDKNYEQQYKDLKRFLELNKLIAKYPKNYRLYIERGDLKNVERYSYSMFKTQSNFTSDIEGAIEDYSKALELNPKAYEVYEKRGDAWAGVNHNPDKTIGKKALRYPEDDQHAINDYKKAIELTGGNDRLYEKLGDRFQHLDPAKALEYYNKIKNIYPERLPVPYKVNQFDFSFDMGPFFYLPLKVASCYAQLGEYDKAIKILEKSKKYGEYHYTSTNLIFIYNWKAGHYKTALKSADNCSVWVCKLAGIFF